MCESLIVVILLASCASVQSDVQRGVQNESPRRSPPMTPQHGWLRVNRGNGWVTEQRFATDDDCIAAARAIVSREPMTMTACTLNEN